MNDKQIAALRDGFIQHSKQLGFNVHRPFAAVVTSFLMREDTDQYRFAFMWCEQLPNEVEMKFLLNNSTYHIKMSIGKFHQLTPNLLKTLVRMNEEANGYITRVRADLKQIPHAQKHQIKQLLDI
jgi:hypothetical protein